MARFVVDMVERLDLSERESGYEGAGKQPQRPALLPALLCHGCATAVLSGRSMTR